MSLPWSQSIKSTRGTSSASTSCSCNRPHIQCKHCLIFLFKTFRYKVFIFLPLSHTCTCSSKFITEFNDLPVACGLSIIHTVNWESWCSRLLVIWDQALSLGITLTHPPPPSLARFSSLSHDWSWGWHAEQTSLSESRDMKGETGWKTGGGCRGSRKSTLETWYIEYVFNSSTDLQYPPPVQVMSFEGNKKKKV